MVVRQEHFFRDITVIPLKTLACPLFSIEKLPYPHLLKPVPVHSATKDDHGE